MSNECERCEADPTQRIHSTAPTSTEYHQYSIHNLEDEALVPVMNPAVQVAHMAQVGMSLADWRWAAKRGYWDPQLRKWNEELGGMKAYLAQRDMRREQRGNRRHLSLLVAHCVV